MSKGTFILDIICKLDASYFKPWNELTEEQQIVLLEGDEANCADGASIGMGYWCHTCHFCMAIESRECTKEGDALYILHDGIYDEAPEM